MTPSATEQKRSTNQSKSPSAIKSLNGLPGVIASQLELAAALTQWQRGNELWFPGVWGGTRSLLSAVLCQHSRPLLVIAPDAVSADLIAADVTAYGVDQSATLPFNSSDGGPEAIRDQDGARRLQVLQQLRQWNPGSSPSVVAAPVSSIAQSVPSPEGLESSSHNLRVGETIDTNELHAWLDAAGFHSTTAVELPGEYSQRGGILDIFALDHPEPIRIELFGDDIDSIRTFDVATQRSTAHLKEIEFSSVTGAHQTSGTVFDFLPEDAAVLILDPPACEHAIEALVARSGQPDAYLSWADVAQNSMRFRLAMGTQIAETGRDQTIDLHTNSVDGFVGEIEYTRRRIDEVGAEHQVFVIADTPADQERMSDLLLTTEAARQGRLHIEIGALSGGFRLPQQNVLVLTGAELFQRSPLRRVKASVRGKPIDSFLQLNAGDLVVHLSHGIGLYRGLELVEKHGQKIEHLAIEFDGGTTIYVPAARIGLIQRYIGGSKSRPRLAKIGGQAWTRHRKAAEQAVSDMATE